MKEITSYIPGWALCFAGGSFVVSGMPVAGIAVIVAGFALLGSFTSKNNR